MQNSPLVSIITVCLNSEKYLERLIQSVILQDYPYLEFIIIDGGSTDATIKIIEKYRGQIAHWVSEPDKGTYDAQNKGIKIAKGDIINILNSDDYFYDKGVVSSAVSFFHAHPDADFLYADMLCCSLDGTEACLKKYPRKITKSYFLRDTLGHCSTFYKKDCFSRAGYFDISYKISADYEWYIRALFKDHLHAQYLGKIIAVFQEGGLSGNKAILENEMNSIISIYYSNQEIFFGKIRNLFFFGDIFRLIGNVILGRKGYTYLRSLNRQNIKAKYQSNLNLSREKSKKFILNVGKDNV